MAQIQQNSDGTYSKSYSDMELALLEGLQQEQKIRYETDVYHQQQIEELEDRVTVLESNQVNLADLKAVIESHKLRLEDHESRLIALEGVQATEVYSQDEMDVYLVPWKVEEIKHTFASPEREMFDTADISKTKTGYIHYEGANINEPHGAQIVPNTMRRYSIMAYTELPKQVTLKIKYADRCTIAVNEVVKVRYMNNQGNFGGTANLLTIDLPTGWNKIEFMIANERQEGGLVVESDLSSQADRLESVHTMSGLFYGDSLSDGIISQRHLRPDINMKVRSIQATVVNEPAVFVGSPDSNGIMMVGDGLFKKYKDEPFVFNDDIHIMGTVFADRVRLKEPAVKIQTLSEELLVTLVREDEHSDFVYTVGLDLSAYATREDLIRVESMMTDFAIEYTRKFQEFEDKYNLKMLEMSQQLEDLMKILNAPTVTSFYIIDSDDDSPSISSFYVAEVSSGPEILVDKTDDETDFYTGSQEVTGVSTMFYSEEPLTFTVSAVDFTSSVSASQFQALNTLTYANVTYDELNDKIIIEPLQLGTVEITITATDTYGESSTIVFQFKIDAPLPDAPTSLIASSITSSKIGLSWTAPTNTMVESYTVKRGTTTVATSLQSTTYEDTGLAKNTSYNYEISAVNIKGESTPLTGAFTTTNNSEPTVGTTLGYLPDHLIFHHETDWFMGDMNTLFSDEGSMTFTYTLSNSNVSVATGYPAGHLYLTPNITTSGSTGVTVIADDGEFTTSEIFNVYMGETPSINVEIGVATTVDMRTYFPPLPADRKLKIAGDPLKDYANTHEYNIVFNGDHTFTVTAYQEGQLDFGNIEVQLLTTSDVVLDKAIFPSSVSNSITGYKDAAKEYCVYHKWASDGIQSLQLSNTKRGTVGPTTVNSVNYYLKDHSHTRIRLRWTNSYQTYDDSGELKFELTGSMWYADTTPTSTSIRPDPGNYAVVWDELENRNHYNQLFHVKSTEAVDVGIDDWNVTEASLRGEFDIYEIVDGQKSGTSPIGTIVAECGSYPNDGMHTDGFYYVSDNAAPTVTNTISDIVVNYGTSHDIDLSGHFSDPDGDPLTYAETENDPYVSVTINGSIATITSSSGLGDYTVGFKAIDDKGRESAKITFIASFQNLNDPPQVVSSISPLTIENSKSIEVNLDTFFSDPDFDTLTYTATADNSNVTTMVYQSKLTISGMNIGSSVITVTATDPDGASVSGTIDVTVTSESAGATAYYVCHYTERETADDTSSPTFSMMNQTVHILGGGSNSKRITRDPLKGSFLNTYQSDWFIVSGSGIKIMEGRFVITGTPQVHFMPPNTDWSSAVGRYIIAPGMRGLVAYRINSTMRQPDSSLTNWECEADVMDLSSQLGYKIEKEPTWYREVNYIADVEYGPDGLYADREIVTRDSTSFMIAKGNKTWTDIRSSGMEPPTGQECVFDLYTLAEPYYKSTDNSLFEHFMFRAKDGAQGQETNNVYSTGIYHDSWGSQYNTMSSSYYFNPDTSNLEPAGTIESTSIDAGNSSGKYKFWPRESIERNSRMMLLLGVNGYQVFSDNDYNYDHIEWYGKRFPRLQKGTFSHSTTKIDDGTYPTNGPKDGYWWVRKGLK